jgi:hypothetical protein
MAIDWSDEAVRSDLNRIEQGALALAARARDIASGACQSSQDEWDALADWTQVIARVLGKRGFPLEDTGA